MTCAFYLMLPYDNVLRRQKNLSRTATSVGIPVFKSSVGKFSSEIEEKGVSEDADPDNFENQGTREV